MQQRISWSFHPIVPSEQILRTAKEMADSEDQDRRDVGRSVLDANEINVKLLLAQTTAPGSFDLSPYFDHWFGDSLDAAQRLIASSDRIAANVAKLLVAQAAAIAKSKASFLEAKK